MSIRRTALTLMFAATAGSCQGGIPTDTSAQQVLLAQSLVPVGNGSIVYDPNINVYWLADANLASNRALVEELHMTDRIRRNGVMTFQAAREWVTALNQYHGTGYLGHTNWQLPITPQTEPGCAVPSGMSGNSFGPGCVFSALGRLYHLGFHKVFPEGIIPPARNTIRALQNNAGVLQPFGGGIQNLQQGLYWTGAESKDDSPTPASANSAFTHTFTTNAQGANTTEFNYFHVLPMVRGAIGGVAPLGTGLIPYLNNRALYDTAARVTWALDAQLAATQPFGISGTSTIPIHDGSEVLTVPKIAPNGMMRFETAHEWIRAMNQANYAGSRSWRLPSVEEMQSLYTALTLYGGYAALLANSGAEPFQNLQRFFYWSCQTEDGATCTPEPPGPLPNGSVDMRWAFNFQSGFQGTAKEDKEFFVMVYFRPQP